MISELVIHDTATGAEDVIHRADVHFEAPNWSPCGGFLVINSGGQILRVDLAAPEVLQRIDTGACTHCNNDHGISPDGLKLMISDSPGRGTSIIYRLPIGGGAPERVTPLAPSYWHGWSPDGARIAYVGRRKGIFHICTSAVDGTDEVILTDGPGHRDGPDYTPDGRWIWFNSDHHGRGADLWRMRPDGDDLQQMTDDERVKWFPHPSPDGRDVLYLAYPEGTTGHPGDLPVELRLMDATGGNIRALAAFNGGQGSINVPCWHPEGGRFAYVRYPKGAPG
ncbi:TolB family protein [Yoonia sp. R2331]|uniref:TolB family protein n=1 Tax=Yoonia sp. R2331 TaxID=3237238 RepID=UPI0034E44D8F